MAGYTNYQYNSQQNGMANMTSPMTSPMASPMGMNTAVNAPFNQQFMFPQPVGSVYNLNTATDIGNIPTGTNVSVGLCLSENVLYIKTLQNGVPSLLGYRLSPIEGQGVCQPETQKNENYSQILERLSRIEKVVFTNPVETKPIEQPTGGRLDWQV